MKKSAPATPHRSFDNNVYAYDDQGDPKHISQVASGKKGYLCMGCNWEMIARKGPKRDHHFAHAPRHYDDTGKCTYSDETYRHKLAKEILQRTKEIRVPAVYVFSEDGEHARKLRDPVTVKATTVRNEIQFYEDENGEVRWGRKVDFGVKERHFIIQPDVTFFDANDRPTLLIELMATHKVDAEKLAKIRRLGIDTVEVAIPKDSPEAIEKVFTVTGDTEWLYNQTQTDAYARGVHFPPGTGTGIPPAAEYQRAVYEAGETFTCRSFQLKDLIRGIGKCLESERYRSDARAIEEEAETVESETAAVEDRLESWSRHRRSKLEEASRGETERIDKSASDTRQAIKRYRERYRN